ncbi:MAG: hypothetical protein DRO96_01590, partial [Candidatus Aenigmatarchaeota archaeon]
CFTYWADKYQPDEFIRLKGEEQYQQIDSKKNEIPHRKSIENLFLNKNVFRIGRAGTTQNTIIKDFIQNIGDLGFPRAKEAQETVKRSEYKGLSRGKIEGYPYSSEQHLIELKKLSKPEQFLDYTKLGTVAYTQYAVETHIKNLHSYLPEYLYNYHPIPKTGAEEKLLTKRISFMYSPEFTIEFFRYGLRIDNIEAIVNRSSKIICNLRDSKYFRDFVYFYQQILNRLQRKYNLTETLFHTDIKANENKTGLMKAIMTKASIDLVIEELKENPELNDKLDNYEKFIKEVNHKVKPTKTMKIILLASADLLTKLNECKIHTSHADRIPEKTKTIKDILDKVCNKFDILIVDRGELYLDSIGTIYRKGKKIPIKETTLTALEYRIIVHTLRNNYRAGHTIELMERFWWKKETAEEDRKEWLSDDSAKRSDNASKCRLMMFKTNKFLKKHFGTSIEAPKGIYEFKKQISYCIIQKEH